MFASSGGKNLSPDVGDIGHSLRFRRSASANLSRTFSAGDRKTWLWAGFVKPCDLITDHQGLIRFGSSYVGLTTHSGVFRLWLNYQSVWSGHTEGAVRDPTSHMHIMFKHDTTQAIAADRFKVWFNGVQQTFTVDGGSLPGLNADGFVNQSGIHEIGQGSAAYLDAYLSRVCFVGGSAATALLPTDFGYLNTEINEWVTKTQSEVKAVVDAGGTNSTMLDFDDGTSLTTLGYDKSSNGNNWTLNNFSLTAGSTYDWMLDVPGNSYATLNPLDVTYAQLTLSNGNLTASNNAVVDRYQWATIQIPPTSKVYAEAVITAFTSGNPSFGIVRSNGASGGATYFKGGEIYANGGFVAPGVAYAAGDVIGVSYDAATQTIEFLKNNVSVRLIVLNTPAELYMVYAGGVATWAVNFGQQPFVYTPPTGFKALCQANLATPAILNPEDHVDVVTVTKSGDTNFTIPWNATDYDTYFEIKRRDAAGDWYQIDGLRGYDKILKSNSTAVETTDANVLGVSGTTGTLKSTLADGAYVITMHKAGLVSARQTNTDGSITSTVSANVEAGFSIVTSTGTGAASSSVTIGHGLGKNVDFLITKNLDSSAAGSGYWSCWHKDLGGNYGIWLDLTGARNPSMWSGYTNFSSTVFSPPDLTYGNVNTNRYVAYCHADIEGYSKAFSYPGNGSADGPYIDLGFKAKHWTTKCSSNATYWIVIDAARDTYNLADKKVGSASSSYENDPSPFGGAGTNSIDIDAFGFKLRDTDSPTNYSGFTYIGIAYADVAGKYSLAR